MSQAMVQPTQHQGGLDVQMQNCTTASLHWGLPQCEAIHMHTYVRTYVCRFIHSYIHSYIQCHQISYVSKYFSIDHGLRRPTIFSLDSPFTPAEAKRLLYIYTTIYISIHCFPCFEVWWRLYKRVFSGALCPCNNISFGFIWDLLGLGSNW